MILSISEAAERLGATANEVIDAAGLTLGELESAAEQCGLFPERYPEAPVLPESRLDLIVSRIADARLALML